MKDKKLHISHDNIAAYFNNFLPLLENHPHRSFIEQLLRSVLHMAQEDMDLLDLKVINSTIRELRYAFSIFEPYRGVPKASVFGSARTPKTDPHYRLAVRFGELLAKNGWMIITGAASGIMQAGNEGAGTMSSFGVNIRLPFEQSANEIILGDKKLIHFKYFFTRKLIFIKESDAIVLFPGGFGTHDEGMEALTLVQTGKTTPRPIVMVDTPKGTYWRDFDRFIRNQLLKRKLISPEDISLYKIVNSPEAAMEELLKFYSNYHSIRLFPDRAIMRLRNRPSEKLLSEINKKFSELLTAGEFSVVEAAPEEKTSEPKLNSMARLSFQFNRRGFGRLRQLIDFLNEKG